MLRIYIFREREREMVLRFQDGMSVLSQNYTYIFIYILLLMTGMT